jgi:sugar (pentulose or hexulose) kinase
VGLGHVQINGEIQISDFFSLIWLGKLVQDPSLASSLHYIDVDARKMN